MLNGNVKLASTEWFNAIKWADDNYLMEWAADAIEDVRWHEERPIACCLDAFINDAVELLGELNLRAKLEVV